MINKNIVAFLLFLAIILGLAGAIYAYFSATSSSSGNTLSTGNLKATLGDDNEADTVNISSSWVASGLMPGQQLTQKKLIVYNSGTENGNHIDMQFSYTGNPLVAKNIVFSQLNNGFRYGTNADATSVNLITNLKGTTDVDYIVTQGANGLPFTTNTVDGVDGTTPDGKISLSELAAFGKIRISPGEENKGIAANTNAELWINAEVLPTLTAQNDSVNVTITFTLDQDTSQF